MSNQLEILADRLSRAVIADEVKPGLGLSHELWELALQVREELKASRLPPLTFHYTMRDALWDVGHAKIVGDGNTANRPASKEAT